MFASLLLQLAYNQDNGYLSIALLQRNLLQYEALRRHPHLDGEDWLNESALHAVPSARYHAFDLESYAPLLAYPLPLRSAHHPANQDPTSSARLRYLRAILVSPALSSTPQCNRYRVHAATHHALATVQRRNLPAP